MILILQLLKFQSEFPKRYKNFAKSLFKNCFFLIKKIGRFLLIVHQSLRYIFFKVFKIMLKLFHLRKSIYTSFYFSGRRLVHWIYEDTFFYIVLFSFIYQQLFLFTFICFTFFKVVLHIFSESLTKNHDRLLKKDENFYCDSPLFPSRRLIKCLFYFDFQF